MQRFDVCNGDADGLCAALQWRLHEPAAATLITGLKREIALLERVQAGAGDEVNVFDLSMQSNRAELLRLLAAGVRVRYFDHHAVDDPPTHPALESHLDGGSEVCSSLLVDAALGGAFRAWALVGAYGDNLAAVADRLALASGLQAERERLRRLGEAINYNAYGDEPGDVCIAPAELYAVMARHRDPLQMLAREPIVDTIVAMRAADLRQAQALPPHWRGERGSVHVLPDASWSRRVLGSIANELANAEPARAHAVLKAMDGGGYAVSVRAPLAAPRGAHELCRRFGGAGRARAAGIERLAPERLAEFIAAFAATDWSGTC